MFTGLIEHVALVRAIDPAPTGVRLRLVEPAWSEGPPARGDSIAVDGCCLTLVEREGGSIAFDVIHQSLRCTTLGDLAPGRRVNLERSLRASDRIGGHFVQGHVDGVGRVLAIRRDGGEHRIRVAVPESIRALVVPRGSIALAGVSLTIADRDADAGWLEVALIPETLERTNLGDLAVGAGVDVEGDYLAKVVVERLAVLTPPA